MSDREKTIDLIDSIPDSQIGYILNMLKNFKEALDEATDDAFCEGLYKDYLDDNDADKNDSISLENFAQDLGIDL